MRQSPLEVCALESREVPATFFYSPATQTLSLRAADGDQLEVRGSGPTVPANFVTVTEVGSGNVVFDSLLNNQPVRSISVNMSTVPTASLLIGPAVRLAGNLDVIGARTTSTFTLGGQVAGNVNYRDVGLSNDTVNIQQNARTGGSLNLALGEGDNTTAVRVATIGSNLSISGRAGSDTVQLMEAGAIIVGGTTSINLGNGTNTVTAVAANRYTTGRDFVYSGFAGADTINFTANTAPLSVGGNMRVTTGGPIINQANVVRFHNVGVGGNLNLFGSVGNDDIRFNNGMVVGGDFIYTAGEGFNYLDMNTTVTNANTIGGRFTYIGGSKVDQVYMDGTTIGKSALIDLRDSDANGQFVEMGYYMTAGNRIYGNLTVRSGRGQDFITISRTEVYNGVLIDTGIGNDSVWIDDSTFMGPTTISLGANNDNLYIETLVNDGFNQALGGNASFSGATSILGGMGDDQVNFSDDNNAVTNARFATRLFLDGGLGTDTMLLSSDILFFGLTPPTAF